MPQSQINGASISYYDAGSGVPLVFLHSFGHNKLMWFPQLAYFLAKGYRVIAPDFRGHGESSFVPSSHTIDAMSRDIIALLHQLKIGDVFLVGISMGGYVSLRAWATDRSVIRGLILSNTKAEADTEEIKKRRQAQIEYINANGVRDFVEKYAHIRLSKMTLEKKPWVLDMVRMMNLSQGSEALAATLVAMIQKTDESPILPTINVPTLITSGSDDVFIPKQSAQLLHENIKGSTHKVIQETAHVSNLEDHVTYNQAVEKFLSSTVDA